MNEGAVEFLKVKALQSNSDIWPSFIPSFGGFSFRRLAGRHADVWLFPVLKRGVFGQCHAGGRAWARKATGSDGFWISRARRFNSSGVAGVVSWLPQAMNARG